MITYCDIKKTRDLYATMCQQAINFRFAQSDILMHYNYCSVVALSRKKGPMLVKVAYICC